MNFTNLLQNRAFVAQNTKSAIYALADYISGQIESVQEFVSGGNVLGHISLPMELDAEDEVINKVTLLSYENINTALQDDDAIIDALVSDTGEIVQVKGSEVFERLQNTIQDLKVQQCFLKYCLETAEVTAEGFLSRVSALTDGIPGFIKEKYMTFISNGGTALNAISSFLSTRINAPTLLEDQYIEVVNFDDYVGNVWESVWTKVVNDVTYCFRDVIWKGITHIGEFLETLWDGVAKLVKWGLTQLFGSLFTSFEQTSKSVQGIIDLPAFQLNLGQVTTISGTDRPYLDKLWNLIYYIKTNYSESYRYSGFYNYRWKMGDVLNMFTGFETVFMESVIDLAIAYDQDGKGIKSICDIPIPLDDPYFDFVLRFGFDSAGNLLFQGFYVCSGGNIGDFAQDDASLFRYLGSLGSKIMATVSKVVPVIYTEPYYTQWGWMLNDQATMLVSTISSSGTISEEDFLNSIDYKFTSVDDNMILDGYEGRSILIFQMLMYACLYSKGFHRLNVIDGYIHRGLDKTNDVISSLYTSNTLYTPSAEGDAPETILDSANVDLTLYSSSTFRPYMVRDVLPVVLHFQTTEERAQEIVNVIRATVIAAVAIFITIKIVKTKRKFSRKLFECQRALDVSALELAFDPTDDDARKKFNKAYSHVRRLNLLGRVIGVTSEAVASESISNFSINKSDSDLKGLYTLIHG